MTKAQRRALPLVALLWLVSFPGSAVGGYDIAHIVKRTCDPGGSLIVADKWKQPQDRDRMLTEPGEVIACPPIGPEDSFQLAAGPERIGRELYVCTYVSLFNGDGADTCGSTGPADGEGSLRKPLMAIRVEESGRLALVGIASSEVAAVAVAPGAGIPPGPTLTPIDRQRAARLGATGAFSFYSLTVDRRVLCANDPPRVLALDSSGRPIAEHTVPLSTRLLDAADRVPYARSLKPLCGARVASARVGLGWLTEMGAMLRSLLKPLI